MIDQQFSQAQLDALARQRGFPDYATWVAWNRHRQAALQQPAPRRSLSAGPVMQQGQPNNVFQHLMTRIPPFSLIGAVGDRFRRATGDRR